MIKNKSPCINPPSAQLTSDRLKKMKEKYDNTLQIGSEKKGKETCK